MSFKQNLHVVNSNNLHRLATLCSLLIQGGPSSSENPFVLDKVIVMNRGMQTYLQQEIANTNTVCAGLEFEQIWGFIWSLHKIINGADAFNRFDHEHMTWSLYSLKNIWLNERDPIFKRMRDYLDDDESEPRNDDGNSNDAKAYLLCGVIADCFDQYQMYRPEWILSWNEFTKEDFDLISSDKNGELNVNGGRIAAWLKDAVKNVKSSHQKFERKKLLDNIWQVKLWYLMKGNLNESSNAASDYDRALTVKHIIDAVYAEAGKSQSDEKARWMDKLPKRLFIFGVTALPSQVIDLFVALGHIVPVFFMHLNPCQEYWGDFLTGKGQWKKEKQSIVRYLRADDLNTKNLHAGTIGLKSVESPAESDEDAYFDSYVKLYEEDEDNNSILTDGNPLLISMGRQGRDTLNELLDRSNEVDITNSFVSSLDELKGDKKTLLNQIKDDLLQLKKRERMPVADDDFSLQIHSCHTRHREIEVLRDAILQTFKREGRSSPKNMLVMVPDIELYAPDIESVFGACDEESPEYIPYAICDKTATTNNNLAEAVIKLLSIGSRKISVSLIIELLSVDAIAKRFGISADDLSVISSWLEQACVHFGLDKEDLKTGESDLPWTLKKGLYRIVEGFILGNNSGSEACDNIDTSDFELLNRFCSFVNKLTMVRDAFNPQLDLSTREWTSKLTDLLLGGFFSADQDDLASYQFISNVLTQMNDSISNLKQNGKDSELKIKLPVFRVKLIHAFGNDRDSSKYLRGKVNFCSFMPMRAVPFDHIFMLGMNDGDFPRKETLPGFNFLSDKLLSRRNDRRMSTDDRFIFLESILSANKSLYISYIGQSPVDRTELNPSAVVTELLEYVSNNFYVEGMESSDEEEISKQIKKRLIRHEYLNAYDLRNYVAEENRGELFSAPSYNEFAFWKQDLKSAKESVKPIGCVPDDNDLNPWGQEIPEQISLNLSEIESFFRNPVKIFLRDVLNIYIPDIRKNEDPDIEPFTLSDFEISNILGSIGFDFSYEEGMKQIKEQLNLKEKKGVIPYGALGKIQKEKIISRYSSLTYSLMNASHSELSDLGYRYSFNLDVAGKKVTVTFAGNLAKEDALIVDYYHDSSKVENYQNIMGIIIRALAMRTTSTASLPVVRIISNDGKCNAYNFMNSSDDEYVLSVENARKLIMKLCELYLRMKLLPVPLSKNLMKYLTEKIKKEERDLISFELFTEKLEGKTLSEIFEYDQQTRYFFSNEHLFDDNFKLLSKAQRELLVEFLCLYFGQLKVMIEDSKISEMEAV
ncbi:MAG: exodeoxyribonuclease V subunit gamma [Succinivibrio sp.]